MGKDLYNTYKGKAYRFLSFNGLYDTIENRTLRFTRVDFLNDPLDSSPFAAPFDWKNLKNEGDEFVSVLKDYINEVVFSSMYVCCFCKEFDTENSYLMWSHYSESHSQVCFEIDFAKNNFLGSPSKIIYPKNLKSFRDEARYKSADEKGLFLVTSKIKQWSYEKEVRLIVDTEQPDLDLKNFTYSHDKHHLYFTFPLNFISKVIFAINAKESDEIKTIEMLRNRGFNPEFLKMTIDPETLKLKAIDYKRTMPSR